MSQADPIFDEQGRFHGFEGAPCEHRTVGSYRAWCLDCTEWCYPRAACVRCERMRAKVIVDSDIVSAGMKVELLRKLFE